MAAPLYPRCLGCLPTRERLSSHLPRGFWPLSAGTSQLIRKSFAFVSLLPVYACQDAFMHPWGEVLHFTQLISMRTFATHAAFASDARSSKAKLLRGCWVESIVWCGSLLPVWWKNGCIDGMMLVLRLNGVWMAVEVTGHLLLRFQWVYLQQRFSMFGM